MAAAGVVDGAALRRILGHDERSALALLANWGTDAGSRRRVADHLHVTLDELAGIERSARDKIRRYQEREGASANGNRETARVPDLSTCRRIDAAAEARRALADGMPPRRAGAQRRRGERLREFCDALADGEMSQAGVARTLGLGQSQASKLKARLIRGGYVEATGEMRAKSPMLRLTDRGRREYGLDFAGSGSGDRPAASGERDAQPASTQSPEVAATSTPADDAAAGPDVLFRVTELVYEMAVEDAGTLAELMVALERVGRRSAHEEFVQEHLRKLAEGTARRILGLPAG